MMVLVTTYTSGGTDMFYGEASASVVLGVLPAFAVAFMLQRYLVKGLALGAPRDKRADENRPSASLPPCPSLRVGGPRLSRRASAPSIWPVLIGPGVAVPAP